jgi:hypothetical protein
MVQTLSSNYRKNMMAQTVTSKDEKLIFLGYFVVDDIRISRDYLFLGR